MGERSGGGGWAAENVACTMETLMLLVGAGKERRMGVSVLGDLRVQRGQRRVGESQSWGWKERMA
jgi:hypothetical protein